MKTYRLLNHSETVKLGDQILSESGYSWNKCNFCIGTQVNAFAIRREITSFVDAPIAERKVQLTELQLGMIHELVDKAYHANEIDKVNDELANILLRLDDSTEAI